jgi:hypothetical protein
LSAQHLIRAVSGLFTNFERLKNFHGSPFLKSSSVIIEEKDTPMKTTITLLLLLTSTLSFAETVHRSGALVTRGQDSLIRTRLLTKDSCSYLELKRCELSEGDYRKLSDLKKPMSCQNFFKNARGISTQVLRDELNQEHAKGWTKGIALVGTSVLAGLLVDGYLIGGGIQSMGTATAISNIPLGVYGVAISTSTIALSEFLTSASRYVNPFYNGAVIEVLSHGVRDRGVETLIDAESLIRQSASIERSMNLRGNVRTRAGNLCPRALR